MPDLVHMAQAFGHVQAEVDLLQRERPLLGAACCRMCDRMGEPQARALRQGHRPAAGALGVQLHSSVPGERPGWFLASGMAPDVEGDFPADDSGEWA